MKRWGRLGVCAAALLLLCASLCGCQELDDMKAAQAFWQDDGSILWNGARYVELPDGDSIYYFVYHQEQIFVTEKDVPVLLSEYYGDSGREHNNGEVITISRNTYDDLFGYSYEESVYCREDCYDSYMSAMQTLQNGTAQFTKYSYEYYVWSEDAQEYVAYTHELTETEVAALCDVLETEAYALNYTDDMYSLTYVTSYTEDAILKGGEWEISAMFDPYVKTSPTQEKRYLLYDGDKDAYYLVPAEYNEIFDAMLEDVLATYREEVYEVTVTSW